VGFYTKLAFRLLGPVSERLVPFFVDIKNDLRKARMKTSLQEYICVSLLTSFIIFLVETPLLTFIFSILLKNFLLAFSTAITLSIFLSIAFFYFFLNYPKAIIRDRSKRLEAELPFTTLYLSTTAGSKLPLHKIFEIFSRFSGYKETVEEINLINQDINVFGFDIISALERASERSPSKKFTELLWGLLATTRTGGNLATYLKEKSKNFIEDYRRKLYEFSHTLTIYIEVYLTAIILGALFFIILTAIVSGMGGAPVNIIFLQYFLTFVFIPLISILFIIMVKASAPGGE